MGFDEGQIVLNSDSGTYFPGQMLLGRLEFDLDKNKTFRGIYAQIKGRCKVHWTTNHTRRVNDRTEHYTVTHESHEEYMNVTIYLIGSKSGEQTLRPGRHVFPFECQIPPHCPSSFEGSEGNIRYSVKVTVDRAFKVDQTKQAVFRVEAPVDLNTNPYCKEPIVFEFEQTFCCWCMNSGLAETLVKLPAGGFCPKQPVPIEVACTNTSTVEIDKIRLSVWKTITFEAEREPDRRSEDSVIAEVKKGPVPANTTRNWTVEMEVPDMDVPNLNNCRFIHVDYRFKVNIDTSGCHTDEDQSRAIFFGTIPLGSLQYPPNSTFENVQNTQNVNNYPGAPVTYQPQPVTYQPQPAPYQPQPPLPMPHSSPNPMGFNVHDNPPYPTVTPVFNPSPYPTSPNMGSNPPYPNAGSNPPYPNAGSNPPYPTNGGSNPSNPPYVTAQHVSSSPYPNSGRSSPYNPNMGPYPGQNPTSSPYLNPHNGGSNPQNVSGGVPTSSPYPPSSPYTGKPVSTELKTGNIGFPSSGNKESMPLLPPNAMPAPASPFASASAPPPSTPDEENKQPAGNGPPYPM